MIRLWVATIIFFMSMCGAPLRAAVTDCAAADCVPRLNTVHDVNTSNLSGDGYKSFYLVSYGTSDGTVTPQDGAAGLFVRNGTTCSDDGGAVLVDNQTPHNCFYRQNLNGDLRQWGLIRGSSFDVIANLANPANIANATPTIRAAIDGLAAAGITKLHTGQVSLMIALDNNRLPKFAAGGSFSCDSPPAKDVQNANYTNLPGSIILGYGASLDAMSNNDVEVYGCAVVLPEWYINPSDTVLGSFGGKPFHTANDVLFSYPDLEAIRANMILAGDTAIKAGAGANIHDISIMGFDNCLNAAGAPQFYGHNVYMDCPIGAYFANNGGGTSIKDFFNDNYLTKQTGFSNEEAWDVYKITPSSTVNAAGRPLCHITLRQASGGPNFDDLKSSAIGGRGDPVYYPMWISGPKAAGKSCTSLSTGRFGNDAAWAIGTIVSTGTTVSFDLMESDYAADPEHGIGTSATWSPNTGVLRIAGPIANIAAGMQVTSSDTGWPGCPSSCAQLAVTAIVTRATGPDNGTNSNDGYNGEVIVSPAPALANSGGDTAVPVTFSNSSPTYSDDSPCVVSNGNSTGNCAFANASERYVSGNSDAGMDIARLPASRGGHLGAGFLLDNISGFRAVNAVSFAHYYNVATIDGPECDFAQLKGDEHGELGAGNSIGIYIAGASRGCNFLSRGPGQKGASIVQDTYGTTSSPTSIGTTDARALAADPNSVGTLTTLNTSAIPTHGEVRLCNSDCSTAEIVAYAVASVGSSGSIAVIARGRFGTVPQAWSTGTNVYPVTVGSSADVDGDKSTSTFTALTTPTVGGGNILEIHHGAALLQNLHTTGSGIDFVSSNTAGVTIAGTKLGSASVVFEDGTAQSQTTITPDSQFYSFAAPGATNLPVTVQNPGGGTFQVTGGITGLGVNDTGKITVGSAIAQWPQNGVLVADSEEMGFAWDSTDPTHVIVTSRGECGTSRAAHTNGSTYIKFIVTELPCGSAGLKGYASNGFTIGAPTGGDQGAGTLNAEAVYRNGAALGAANWSGGATTNQASGSTAYYPCQGYVSSGGATEPPFSSLASFAGTLRNLHVLLSGTPGIAGTVTITVRVNASGTTLACTISGVSTGCNDLSHAAAVAAGQTCSVQAVLSSGASSVRVHTSTEFDN